jgi:hypothetical protein
MEIVKLRNKSTAAVLGRLKSITGTDTDAGLSTALGVSPQTLSSWKSRESTPYSICVDVAERLGVSLDWLLGGTGPMRRDGSPLQLSDDQVLNPWEERVITLLRSLSDEDQRNVRSVIAEKKRARELELRVEELSAALADIKRPA